MLTCLLGLERINCANVYEMSISLHNRMHCFDSTSFNRFNCSHVEVQSFHTDVNVDRSLKEEDYR